MIGRIKNLIIFGLLLSGMYLTGKLWFDEISNHNFFYTIASVFDVSQPDTDFAQNYVIKPIKIITNLGDSYDLQLNGIEQSQQKKDCDEAIAAVLSDGEYVGATTTNWQQLILSPGYACRYAIEIPTATFVKTYPQRGSSLTSRVREFNWVFVIPVPESSGVRVVFLNDVDGRAHEYSLANTLLEQRITDNLDAFSSQVRLRYSLTDEFFVPVLNNYRYPAVVMENPYMDEGGLLIEYIQKKAAVFFPGAGSKWNSPNGQIFTYSDENTVVKYYPSEVSGGLDMLEYSYYKVLDRRRNPTLAADYNTAVQFITRDTSVVNEYYLDYSVKDDTKHRRVFYFNYAINDLPISVSSVSGDQMGLHHPIEIVVENGVVTRYRKLVYNFISDGLSKSTASLTFNELTNTLLTEGQQLSELDLSLVSLSYKIDTNNELTLYWFLDLNGIAYIKSAYKAF